MNLFQAFGCRLFLNTISTRENFFLRSPFTKELFLQAIGASARQWMQFRLSAPNWRNWVELLPPHLGLELAPAHVYSVAH